MKEGGKSPSPMAWKVAWLYNTEEVDADAVVDGGDEDDDDDDADAVVDGVVGCDAVVVVVVVKLSNTLCSASDGEDVSIM